MHVATEHMTLVSVCPFPPLVPSLPGPEGKNVCWHALLLWGLIWPDESMHGRRKGDQGARSPCRGAGSHDASRNRVALKTEE
jgi:hypothetical protein